MPHVIRKPGVLAGTGLAVFLALMHTVNDAITAILGALLPTIQARFDAGPTLLAIIVATYSIASSVTQPVFGALAEQRSLRLVGAIGVLFSALFLSLVGVAPILVAVFALLVVGGMGSAALHPVGTAIAGGPSVANRALGVGFFTAGGMIGFALGPVLILFLVARYSAAATAWLSGPVNVVIVQDLAPHAPAAAAGMVLGVSIAVAGALYGALGWINQAVGLAAGMTIGFALVAPAAAIGLTVLIRVRSRIPAIPEVADAGGRGDA
jgi:FSR family fosmidomycin resistance protein-like MFS transporter